jgi:hypothetical protein
MKKVKIIFHRSNQLWNHGFRDSGGKFIYLEPDMYEWVNENSSIFMVVDGAANPKNYKCPTHKKLVDHRSITLEKDMALIFIMQFGEKICRVEEL